MSLACCNTDASATVRVRSVAAALAWQDVGAVLAGSGTPPNRSLTSPLSHTPPRPLALSHNFLSLTTQSQPRPACTASTPHPPPASSPPTAVPPFIRPLPPLGEQAAPTSPGPTELLSRPLWSLSARPRTTSTSLGRARSLPRNTLTPRHTHTLAGRSYPHPLLASTPAVRARSLSAFALSCLVAVLLRAARAAPDLSSRALAPFIVSSRESEACRHPLLFPLVSPPAGPSVLGPRARGGHALGWSMEAASDYRPLQAWHTRPILMPSIPFSHLLARSLRRFLLATHTPCHLLLPPRPPFPLSVVKPWTPSSAPRRHRPPPQRDLIRILGDSPSPLRPRHLRCRPSQTPSLPHCLWRRRTNRRPRPASRPAAAFSTTTRHHSPGQDRPRPRWEARPRQPLPVGPRSTRRHPPTPSLRMASHRWLPLVTATQRVGPETVVVVVVVQQPCCLRAPPLASTS